VLCYTGQARVSGATIARVMAAYERGDPRVTDALPSDEDVAAAMARRCAREMQPAGGLLSNNWTHQQMLDPGCARPTWPGSRAR